MSELIFATSDKKESYKISTLVKAGKIRKIAPRIYSNNLVEDPGLIVKRNILEVLGNLYPGAVLSHRSAFEFKPTITDQIFITYNYTRKIRLPGVQVNILQGNGPVKGDNKLFGELFVSSKERAFLENLQITRKMGPDSKCLALPQIEEKLDDILLFHGENGLNDIRDKARKISAILNMEKEFNLLNRIIGALFGTKPSKILKSDSGLSRAAGFPFDKNRIELFEKVFTYLYGKEFSEILENNTTPNSFRNFAFFEAYFSNYIEGTKFEVAEAKKIIDTGIPLPSRGGDSHDILGTYQLVSDRSEMEIIPETETEFLELLKRRHQVLLKGRTEKNPGIFKTVNNMAGNTYFVDSRLVQGTLIHVFKFYNFLKLPFARAAFMMFIISEVHPFEDGNGRIARIMMNAELVKQGQSKIIIPNIFREDYLLTLKKLTNESDPIPYTEMLVKACQFSSKLHFENYDDLYRYLETHNAFFEPNEGKHLKLD